MGLIYYFKRAAKTWRLSFSGWRVSFGFWISLVRDEITPDLKATISGSDKLQKYQYRPLEHPNDIRLLELEPGAFHDPLRGRIISTHSPADYGGGDALNWPTKFEALSYVWGATQHDSNDTLRILLEDGYLLLILPNLDTALRHLRSPTITKTIWVDLLCINQDDPRERSVQVSIMQQIYARAEVVNIWLGDQKGHSDMGMQVLRYLAHNTLHDQAPWTQLPGDDLTAGFREVLERGWFSRIWVVQEAAVSQKALMICGNETFRWTNDPVLVRKFIRRIKYAAISPQWDEAGLSEVNIGRFLQVLNLQMQHIERQRQQVFTLPPDILDIAFELRHRKATDRRDKIYAIMGLVDQPNGSNFQPDYSMNVEAVFQRLLDSIEI